MSAEENQSVQFPVGVLISGRGSNFIRIHQAQLAGRIAGHIACVISSRPDAEGLAYAREHGIPSYVLPAEVMRREDAFAETLIGWLQQHHVQLVVLAGFLKKIPDAAVQAYAGRMINIHPALLPAFGGKGMYGRRVHEAVLDYGCKVSGATVHIVTAEYDAGPPVLQKCVPVLEDDTPDTLARRVLEVEHELLPHAVDLFARGLVEVRGRRVVIRQA